ncbi:LPS export ABC transporter periplasmic protein LptC [Cyanobium sp. Morenito 9A2]|uniref:LPS export ABC transporter periplasmic protein LptC n=1 Tax=Cyanobium sp. Morenito 9A2 TaxID=2823718 RepID=UPI0020CBD8CB|nr:LPS export ABC transporter periplasmic protein LptC [Cyanobium sp. Morenito 9A2]MCP9850570.1 LPS export ABC transporter periplasmic protein LptC [Cyanobium sp. Morenito 9A2]
MLLLLPLAGCWSTPVRQEKPLPFVFRSLNLRQQDSQGRPAWELRSPEARYELAARMAYVRFPRGVIYTAGQARYRIRAARGTVFNDGERITLEQGVTIEVIGDRPVQITGDRVNWIPRQQLMEIDRRPVALDDQSRLSASTARFRLDLDRIELRGQPKLERWEAQPGPAVGQKGAAPIAPKGQTTAPSQRQGPPKTVLMVATVDWHPGSGSLLGSGPVQGIRKGDKGSRQLLSASRLVGNTREQWLDFQAPVKLTDTAQKALLQAGLSRWNFGTQRITSARPFSAVVGQLRIQGSSFEIQQKEQSVVVPQACDLRQPGDWLQATACHWNWTTQAFKATGGVLLRRTANKQVTRASEVSGSLGAKGLAVFTTPGGRVSSLLELPPKAPQRAPSAPVLF